MEKIKGTLKIFTEPVVHHILKLNKISRNILYIGFWIHIVMLLFGTALFYYAKHYVPFDELSMQVATETLKNSFLLLGEAIAGAFILDYLKNHKR